MQRFAVEQLHGDEQVSLVLADFLDLATLGWFNPAAVRAARQNLRRAVSS
ncbi:MAG: hypothetical protein ACRD2A_25960 [Vicinamibacterales bacterium]